MELTTCWSIWPRIEEMVPATLEKSVARLFSAFITPVRLALEVGACDAVAKADARLVSPVASDWLSPGPPRMPFSWSNRSAMVSYCEEAPPADNCSWAEKLVGDALDAGDVHAHQLAVGGQGLLVHHPAGIARGVEIGDVIRHHAERGGVGLERTDGAAGDTVQAHAPKLQRQCSAQTCRKPRAMIWARFFRPSARLFTLFRRAVQGGRVCRSGSSCPAVCVRHHQGPREKFSKKAANRRIGKLAHPLRWVCRIIIGLVPRACVSDLPPCPSRRGPCRTDGQQCAQE